jgi:hypothetical protein
VAGSDHREALFSTTVGGELIEHIPEARRMSTYGRHFVELAVGNFFRCFPFVSQFAVQLKRENCHERSNILRSFVALDDGAFRIPTRDCHFRSDGSAFTCFCRSPPTTEKSREVQERNNPIDSASERAGDVRATAGDAVAK